LMGDSLGSVGGTALGRGLDGFAVRFPLLGGGVGGRDSEGVLFGFTGLGGVGIRLGLLCPRGTKVLPLTTGAEGGC